MMCAGIAGELEGIDLGDERLNKRGKKVLEALAANPEASIHAACQGWKETLAAYRFFDNAGVRPEALLAPHRQATVRRMQEQPTALVVQDTTELDFTAHPPRGVRCLNQATRFGLYQHAHLAVTPDKLPLGVLATEHFDRAAESLGQADQRAALPIEDKESFRWLKGYRLACEVAAQCPGTRIVSVADREADLYDLYVEAQEAAVLDDAEWKSVWCVVKKQPLPKLPPKLSEMMKLVTELGGYNNRAKELPPGPQPLWVGLRRMLDFATAWLNFGPEAQKTCV
jgi:hypothetical protein